MTREAATSDTAPHCGTASVTWGTSDRQLTVSPVPRTWAQAEAAAHHQVSPARTRSGCLPFIG